MFDLKTLSKDAIPSALTKAKHYRFLNEPSEAESICRDILAVDPGNQDAMITLLLALTDSFKFQLTPAFNEAQEILNYLNDQYCKSYYNGIICERRAKVHLERKDPGAGRVAYEWFRKAMEYYESALNSCSPGNQDAILRWNTCARTLMRHPGVVPASDTTEEQMLE